MSAKQPWLESVDTIIRFGGNLDPKTSPTGNLMALVAPPPLVGHSDSALPLAEKGKVIVVFGCRGGAGSTMLSVNMAASLARAGKHVCLLDLDLQLGDVFVALDLEANTSLAALARDAQTGKLDGPQVRRRMQRHDCGVYALSQTGRLDDIDPSLPEKMPQLMATLTEHFEYVIIDGVRDFGDHALAALDMADQIALVLTQDVPSVRRASRVIQLARKIGYAERKIQVVVNRHSARAAVAESEIERVLGLPIAMLVRNDYDRVRAAFDEGALLGDVARGAGVTRDVERLTLALTQGGVAKQADLSQPVQKVDRGGLLDRFFKKEKK